MKESNSDNPCFDPHSESDLGKEVGQNITAITAINKTEVAVTHSYYHSHGHEELNQQWSRGDLSREKGHLSLTEEEQIRGEVELNGEDLQQTAMFVLGEDSHNNLCYCRIIRPVQPDSVSSFC